MKVFLFLIVCLGLGIGFLSYQRYLSDNAVSPVSSLRSPVPHLITSIAPTSALPQRTEALFSPSQIGQMSANDSDIYLTVLRNNFNHPIAHSTLFAGVVRRKKMAYVTYGPWDVYVEIKNTSSAVNNPYHLWFNHDKTYLLLVDDRGAGSGDGTAKVVEIGPNSWGVIGCYYFTAETFKPEAIESFQLPTSPLAPYEFDEQQQVFFSLQPNSTKHVESNCTNFELIFY